MKPDDAFLLTVAMLVLGFASILAVRTAVVMIAFKRELNRMRSGQCVRCGYDMRKPEDARIDYMPHRAACPDCGTAQGYYPQRPKA